MPALFQVKDLSVRFQTPEGVLNAVNGEGAGVEISVRPA